MTANPLLKQASASSFDAEERLAEYVEKINRQPFVAAYGWKYFVAHHEDGRPYLGKLG